MIWQGRNSPVVALTIIAMLALALRGCAERAADSVERRISLWTLALRPFFDDYVRARIAEFERANPGVVVDWVDVPFDALDRKLITAASAGRAPDVVNFSDKTFARFVALGAMADLKGRLPGEASARYLGGALRVGQIDGGLLALPWYLTTQTVLANTEMLAEGDLRPEDVPQDWTRLRAMAREFYAKTGKPLFSVPLGTESDLPMLLMADGVPPLRADTLGRLRSALSHPEARAVLAEWVSLFRAGALPRESVTGGSAHLTEAYQNGRVAIINSGPNFLKRVRDVSPRVFEATRVLPPITGSLGRAHIAVMVLCVSSQSKHPDLAAALAWHLTGEAAQEELCRLVPVLPSTAASLDSQMFLEQVPGAAPVRDAATEKIAKARATSAASLRSAIAFTPALGCWPEMRRAFEDRIKRVLLDGADLDETLRRLDAEWDQIMDAYGPRGIGAACLPPMEPASARPRESGVAP